MVKSIHGYISKFRCQQEKWFEVQSELAKSEGRKPPTIFDFYDAAADMIALKIKEEGLKEVSAHPAPFNGGEPLTTYTITRLREAGVLVVKEE